MSTVTLANIPHTLKGCLGSTVLQENFGRQEQNFESHYNEILETLAQKYEEKIQALGEKKKEKLESLYGQLVTCGENLDACRELMETIEEMCHQEKVEFLKVCGETERKETKPWDEIQGPAWSRLAYPLSSQRSELTVMVNIYMMFMVGGCPSISPHHFISGQEGRNTWPFPSTAPQVTPSFVPVSWSFTVPWSWRWAKTVSWEFLGCLRWLLLDLWEKVGPG